MVGFLITLHYRNVSINEIFTQWKSTSSLNLFLLRIHKNNSELLLALDRPEISLHTNDCERDIRDHVKKQKSAVKPAAISVANAATPSPV